MLLDVTRIKGKATILERKVCETRKIVITTLRRMININEHTYTTFSLGGS